MKKLQIEIDEKNANEIILFPGKRKILLLLQGIKKGLIRIAKFLNALFEKDVRYEGAAAIEKEIMDKVMHEKEFQDED